MGAICGKVGMGKDGKSVDLHHLMSAPHVSEGMEWIRVHEELDRTNNSEEQWDEILRKGPEQWGEMRLIETNEAEVFKSRNHRNHQKQMQKKIQDVVRMKSGKGWCRLEFDTATHEQKVTNEAAHLENETKNENTKKKVKKINAHSYRGDNEKEKVDGYENEKKNKRKAKEKKDKYADDDSRDVKHQNDHYKQEQKKKNQRSRKSEEKEKFHSKGNEQTDNNGKKEDDIQKEKRKKQHSEIRHDEKSISDDSRVANKTDLDMHTNNTKNSLYQKNGDIFPVTLQSILPIPPQSECYFEVKLSEYFPPFSGHDISNFTYAALGIASETFPPKQLPGVLPQSIGILSTGAIHVENPIPTDQYEMFLEGDIVGCLICRRNGTVVFTLNGRPLRICHIESVTMTLPEDHSAKNFHRQSALSKNSTNNMRKLNKWENFSSNYLNLHFRKMFVTVGLMGKGAVEINFGGKQFVYDFPIRDINKTINSCISLSNCGFGKKLSTFNAMKHQLKLFYDIFDPLLSEMATEIAILNIARVEEFENELQSKYGSNLTPIRQAFHEILRRKLFNFLAEEDPSKLQKIDAVLEDAKGDADRVDEILFQKYQKRTNNTSVRRQDSVQNLFLDYFKLKSTEVKEDVQTISKNILRDKEILEKNEDLKKQLRLAYKMRLEKIYEASGNSARVNDVEKLLENYFDCNTDRLEQLYYLNLKITIKYGYDISNPHLLDPGYVPKCTKRRRYKNQEFLLLDFIDNRAQTKKILAESSSKEYTQNLLRKSCSNAENIIRSIDRSDSTKDGTPSGSNISDKKQTYEIEATDKRETSEIEDTDKKETSKIEDTDKKETSEIEDTDKKETSEIEDTDKKETSEMEDTDKKETSEMEDADKKETSEMETSERNDTHKKETSEIEDTDKKESSEMEDTDKKETSAMEDTDKKETSAMEDTNKKETSEMEGTDKKEKYDIMENNINNIEPASYVRNKTVGSIYDGFDENLELDHEIINLEKKNLNFSVNQNSQKESSRSNEDSSCVKNSTKTAYTYCKNDRNSSINERNDGNKDEQKSIGTDSFDNIRKTTDIEENCANISDNSTASNFVTENKDEKMCMEKLLVDV